MSNRGVPFGDAMNTATRATSETTRTTHAPLAVALARPRAIPPTAMVGGREECLAPPDRLTGRGRWRGDSANRTQERAPDAETEMELRSVAQEHKSGE